MLNTIPVITVDGPSGVGKGTLASCLASHLGWHFLDSGAVYRLLALSVISAHGDLANEKELQQRAEALDICFKAPKNTGVNLLTVKAFLEGQEVTEAIRSERCGQAASQIASFPGVRTALLERQRAFRKAPGLVADGRDMGTVVFADASIKFFLNAGCKARAERRYKQLKEKGINVSLEKLVQELMERDQRDMSRSVAPLAAAPDAIIIDSTNLTREQVFSFTLEKIREKMGK